MDRGAEHTGKGIVLITIPGFDKVDFANRLHEATGGSIELVIIQKPKRRSVFASLKRLYRTMGFFGIPRELWYALVLRLSKKRTRALGYFRTHSVSDTRSFVPEILETEDVNGEEAYAALSRIAPKLLVVWGSTLLTKQTLATAERAINLHLGYCPHYRGALANQHAVLKGERDRIGATIHYINGRADAGDMLAVLAGDASKKPRELFRDLNDRARETYVDIATRLHRGESIPVQRQGHLSGNTLLLREWTPHRRFRVCERILRWEEE